MQKRSTAICTLGLFAILISTGLLAGCITSELIVSFNTEQVAHRREETPQNAIVQVADFRREARPTATSVRQVLLTPPATDIVKSIIEVAADEVLARMAVAGPQTVQCEIHAFSITTPASMFYWDVTTEIELVLHVGGHDRTISGMARERTYIWPSGQLIERVTSEALREVKTKASAALAESFASRN